ncbi:hypothetical protein [Lichenifustis flavocetrariae]|uniref:Uncharacterized protein n=1 Tax=Lichenifustis flavocetrariae TaxID=2949735 RepID=A0AA42CJU0_9HYPH|nr:hypothetical protein [Lichenifustis flavocetrariae]MCW6509903.1 hypothetical protein [Lichenifustis flavocetrariae]
MTQAPSTSTIRTVSRQPRTVLLASLALSFVSLCGGAARADCQTDINAIMKRRIDAVAQINGIAKKNGGKLDPIAACPRLRSLASVEAEGMAYFTKNQEWCNLPPDFVSKMTDAHAKTVGFAAKACAVAVKMKQMQTQQAQQAQEALPKLPEGPL